MTKEVAALDIDDVVVKHVEGFIAWSNQTYGTELTPDDYTEEWHEIWSIDKDEVESRKKLFFTDEIIGNFELIEGAPEGLTALSGIRKIIGVTSRRESLRSITKQVLETTAPGAVSDIVHATYFHNEQKITRSKADICREIGATTLIDDHLKHCLAVNEVGIDSILFGEYRWNESADELPPGITRTKDWPGVIKIFEAKDLDPVR